MIIAIDNADQYEFYQTGYRLNTVAGRTSKLLSYECYLAPSLCSTSRLLTIFIVHISDLQPQRYHRGRQQAQQYCAR